MENHEHNFNYALGAVLQTRRRGWKNRIATEMNGGIVGGGRADNLIYPDAMQPVAVEAAFAGTPPDIDRDAVSRLGRTESKTKREIMTAVALAIPDSARRIKGGVAGMQKWLREGGELQYAVYSLVRGETGEIPGKGYDVRYPDGEPNGGYIRGTAADLADLIELAATPDKKIKQIARQAGGVVRGRAVLMYDGLPDELRRRVARKVGQPPDIHAMRVAACIWLNALVLHEKLAAVLPEKIAAPYSCKNWRQTARAWEKILDIDYKSVFRPALESLEILSAHGALADEVLSALREQAHDINALRLGYAADVSSDMFPELVDEKERKTTAAFYTRMEVAELLAGLAFNLIPDDGRDLKIADFACGTGALLKAAYRQVRRRAEPVRDSFSLHRRYMEKYLHGADIQPIAAHLTAAGLAGMQPGAAYKNSNIICAGVRGGKTGALDLLKSESLTDLFGESSAAGADESGTDAFRSADNSFDLCIMNPPYTSYHGGMKLFDVAGVPESERGKSIVNLNEMLRNSFANTKAGMASAFCLLGDRKLKAGGILAAVLPASAAGQGSWRKFRAHMLSRYSDVTVVGLVPGSGKSFSADTGMEEMLVFGAKNGAKTNGVLTVINLHQVPRDFIEAHEIARVARNIKTHGELKVGGHVFGACVKSHPGNGESWGAVGGKNYEMGIIAENLAAGKLIHVGLFRETNLGVPVKILRAHIQAGPAHNQIGHLPGKGPIGAFTFRKIRPGEKTALSLWEANHKTQIRLLCAPTKRGMLMAGREKLARKMTGLRSTLFISRNLRITSQCLAAATTKTPCMGGRAWTALLGDGSVYAAYCLWLNSTPGLIVRWQCAGKQHQGRLQMQIRDIENFPSPAFSEKTAAAKRAVEIANAEFPRLAKSDLLPCSMAWRDNARKEIDRVVLRILGLDKKVSECDMQALREEWCREPSVHGGKKEILKALRADGLL
ncbi:MAG: N-6 DNA methylase [Gammaproteobacteria bacterium]